MEGLAFAKKWLSRFDQGGSGGGGKGMQVVREEKDFNEAYSNRAARKRKRISATTRSISKNI
jgi:biotin carboxylase